MTDLDEIITLCKMERALRSVCSLDNHLLRWRAYDRAGLPLGALVLRGLDEKALRAATIYRTRICVKS